MVAPQIGLGLGEFERAHPDVCAMTDAMADEVVSIVRRGEAELGVGPERATGDDVTSTFLMDVPIQLVCPARHPLAMQRAVSWKNCAMRAGSFIPASLTGTSNVCCMRTTACCPCRPPSRSNVSRLPWR